MTKIKITWLLSFLIIFAISNVRAELSLLGLTFPEPQFKLDDSILARAISRDGKISGDLWIPETDTLLSFNPPMEKRLLFYLSDSGLVDSVIAIGPDLQNLVGRLSKSFASIQFAPAIYNKMRKSFILPATLIYGSGNSRQSVTIQFPYCRYNDSRSAELINESFSINNMKPPRLTKFPSYFFPFKEKESITHYPFAIFRADIDSAGKLFCHEDICNTFPGFADIISRVIMYADFEPAQYEGSAIPSSLYVIIRFFDRLKYPVPDWPPDVTGVIDFPFDFVRIDPVLYLDSLINPPYPKNIIRGLLKNNLPVSLLDTIRIKINIDTSGKVSKVIFMTATDKEIKNKIEKTVKKIQFTAARDINDNLLEYSGIIQITHENNKYLRILFPWLPREIMRLDPVSD
jgi:hypothetical protein